MYVNPTISELDYNILSSSTLFSTLSSLVSDDGSPLFSSEDLIEITDDQSQVVGHIIYISTTEQFVKLKSYQINTEANKPLYIKIKNNLYFQNDIKYREGFINGFCWRQFGEADIHVQADDSLDEVILQGIQITGEFFFYGECETAGSIGNSKVFFDNIYFKDCVFTKQTNDTVKCQAFGFKNAVSDNNKKFLLRNCKISIHIRAGEFGYHFDNGYGWAWENCSRYIEYSDIDTESVPQEAPSLYYFGAPTENCATIVRNLACKLSADENGIKRFVKESINSSWDIEIYKIVYAASTMNWYKNHALHFSTNNCFVSVKVAEIINESTGNPIPSHVVIFDDGSYAPNTIGVNVYNKGDVGQSDAAVALSHPNVAQLADTECHDVNKLNQFGFFVNRAYTFTLLTSKPSNWDTDYNTYYIKVERAYTINNSNVWAENTYYQKVYL